MKDKLIYLLLSVNIAWILFNVPAQMLGSYIMWNLAIVAIGVGIDYLQKK